MKIHLMLTIISIGIIIALRMMAEDTSPVFSQIVRDMGYTVSEEPVEIVEFTIPEEFNAVYERYNNMLRQNGFDLTLYKGKKCKRYTYMIEPGDVRANIIVYDGKIIGGDISGITLDGIMIPIENNP